MARGQEEPFLAGGSHNPPAGTARRGGCNCALVLLLLVGIPVITVLLQYAVNVAERAETDSTSSDSEAKKRDWGYSTDHSEQAPADWPGVCGTGKAQSPINIEHQLVRATKLDDFEFVNYDREVALSVVYGDYTLKLDLPPALMPGLTGGGLSGAYSLIGVHLHWSQANGNGSEHTVNGTHYPAEMHFVHLKNEYTLKKALGKSHGLAVIGVMLQVEDDATNPEAFTNLIESSGSGDDILVRPYALLPEDKRSFYRYDGSLTTPPCSEVVVWTVLQQPLAVTQQLLDTLRQLRSAAADPVVCNSRPVQPLNGRLLKRNQ